MNKYLTKAALGLTLGATALTVAAPADAQRWRGGRGGWHHGGRGGDVAAGAVLGGIVGLGVGAAIASNNNRYYDRGYYYGPPRGYYRNYYGPPPRRFYRQRWRGYYGDPYAGGYYGRPYGGYYGGGYYGGW